MRRPCRWQFLIAGAAAPCRERPLSPASCCHAKTRPPARSALDAITASAGDFAVLRKDLPAPGAIYSSTFDRLLVLADCEDAEKAPLALAPFVIDTAKPGSTLAEWTQLPLAGVDQVVLPGFHTPAEVSLKRAGTGEDVFQTVCGLMASGCRTVLLSRWRVGGQSTSELIGEFVQELPHDSADDAWRRACNCSPIACSIRPSSPRLKASPTAEGIKADHPFFWSGYLLIDTGVVPER